MTLLNTRPQPQNAITSQNIRQDLNINVIEFPTIKISYILQDRTPQQLAENLQQVDYFIFTSVNAVEASHTMLEIFTKTVTAIAVGKKTQAALMAKGWQKTLKPAQASSEGILAMPEIKYAQDKQIVIVTGKNGRGLLEEALTKQNLKVRKIECYQRVINEDLMVQPLSKSTLMDVDVVLISSVDCFKSLHEILQKDLEILAQTSQWLVFSARIKEHLKTIISEKSITVCEPSEASVIQSLKLICKELQ